MTLEEILPWIILSYLSGTLVIALVMAFLTYLGTKPYLKLWMLHWAILSVGYIILYLGLIYNIHRLVMLYFWFVVVGSVLLFRASCVMRAIIYTHLRLVIHGLIILVTFIMVWMNITEGLFAFFYVVLPSVLFVSGGIVLLTKKDWLYAIAGGLAILIGINYFFFPYLSTLAFYLPSGYLMTAVIGMCFGVSILGIYFIEVSQEQRRLRDKLFYMSFHDRLTGLHNRAYFDERLEKLHNERVYPLSMIVMDLNNLKTVNDMHGHRYGDEMLIKTASLLQTLADDAMIVTRYGGDEFVVILPHSNEAEAIKLARTIHQECKTILIKNIPLDIAIGYAEKSREDEPLEHLFDRAEIRMYLEKNQ